MTLQPQTEFSIPQETARVARAAYPKGNVYLKMRDALGTIYQDEMFAPLFPQNGRPVEAPWRLALITVMQFLEELPDRQAAEAVRGRIDWKYLLGLELTDSGFDATVLCEFRKRLVEGGAEHILLEAMLTLFKQRGWVKARQSQRTDSTHVLAKVRAINRLMCVGEAMRFALNSLAIVAGDWLLEHSDAAWVRRYGHRIEEGRFPRGETERQVVAEVIGQDGFTLLAALFDDDSFPLLREIPAVEILRQIWVQNYYYEDGRVRWREQGNIPLAKQFINSPYDSEARFSKKRSTMWTGYKVHLTETCDQGQPHLITHVATTPAPKTDEAVTEVIQTELDQAELTPRQHLLDAGYVTSQVLVTSQKRFGIEVVGPPPADVKWQANAKEGFDISQFFVDWERQHVICPQGKTSPSWTPALDSRGHQVFKVKFSTKDCSPCPSRSLCIHSDKPYQRRTITVRPQEQHEALQVARQRQLTPDFARRYALREGIEATISQGVRAFGMRRSRYIGEAKTHLQHIGIATAINLVRIIAWLDGDLPAPTRVSAYERLYSAA
ncbi:MAG TPA: IS1182 family transposase [Ktedonosporobacter sp.]|nr:IS1182 family transposase [Ktedonosporobacter sp.]